MNFSGFHRAALSSTLSKLNWNLECWFLGRRKPKVPGEKPSEKGQEPTTKLNPAISVGGKCSYHRATPAPPTTSWLLDHFFPKLKLIYRFSAINCQ